MQFRQLIVCISDRFFCVLRLRGIHKCPYFTLVVEFCGVDVQLLKLLFELGKVSLQPCVLQFGLIQLTLELLVICCQQLIVIEKLSVRLVQP